MDTANSKENAAKEEMGMTLLICFAHSDANDGRGRRYSSYGRNTFFSWQVPFNGWLQGLHFHQIHACSYVGENPPIGIL